MELSKLKYIQPYMNYFDLYFRRFECNTQSNELSITFTPSMENIFETLETSEFEMNKSHSII